MLINVTKELKNGTEAIKVNDEIITVREVLTKVLLEVPIKDATIDSVMKSYKLGEAIRNNDEVELTSEDITMIKNLLIGAYVPLIAGQVINILESN